MRSAVHHGDQYIVLWLAQTSPPDTDTVRTAGVATASQYNEVEMTHNPAYGPIATIMAKGEEQYEEVAPASGGYSN